MSEFEDRRVIEFVRQSVQHWNDRNIQAMEPRFREDAVLSSPFGPDAPSSTLFQGKTEIIAHLQHVRSQFSAFKILDVATDTIFYTILLSDDRQFLTMIVQPDLPALLIRRMIICKSVFHST